MKTFSLHIYSCSLVMIIFITFEEYLPSPVVDQNYKAMLRRKRQRPALKQN